MARSADKPLLASRPVSKKLEQKQQRRLAEERKKEQQKREQRKKNLVTLAIAVVVIGAVSALVISDRRATSGPVGVAAAEADCGPKEEFEAPSADHVEEGTPVEYGTNPPTVGPHAASPGPTGFFDTPQEAEHLIHNMEHGQIVLWYDPAAPQQVKDDLEAIVEKQLSTTVATPYEGLEEYNFYMTAWNKLPDAPKDSEGTGYYQGCDLVSEDAINEFRREHQGKSPEPITPPFEG